MKDKTRVKSRKSIRQNLGKIVGCFSSGDHSRTVREMIPSLECIPADHSLVNGISNLKLDSINAEEAELSLRQQGSLNSEEARALLGQIEYQKGNIEAALHVFEGIDFLALAPKIKVSLSRREEHPKRHSQNLSNHLMPLHAVDLIFKAMLLKSKSLQHLRRFREAAQCCKLLLDMVESSLPDGLPENFAPDCKLQETITKGIKMLPELWKLADCSREAIMSYRRILLYNWNLDIREAAQIQKDFAIYLLYIANDYAPPNLRSQFDGSFVPKNGMEEAILLLMILLQKASHKTIPWDRTVLDHLSFALSISGDLKTLANQVLLLLPGTIDRRELYYTLALCYYGSSEEQLALNLLEKLLHKSEDPDNVPALLLASNICGKTSVLAEKGTDYAHKALQCLQSGCNHFEGLANCLLSISLSAQSRVDVTESERVSRKSESLKVLEHAAKVTRFSDPNVLYHLSLENAEQRKLDAALVHAKQLLKLEGGSNLNSWLLVARILSAKKQYSDAEDIISTALDQTGKWDQGTLLRTRAKLQIAQGRLKGAIGTYTHLLALIKIHQSKNSGSVKARTVCQGKEDVTHMELDVWHDLALVYISLSRWRDAEICLSKSKSIDSCSASRCHVFGVLHERKGSLEEALKCFITALDIEPTHVPSLVSAAVVFSRLRRGSSEVSRSFLMEALRLDRMNAAAWYHLGLLHKAEATASAALDAAECFEAATFLEDSQPVEPFR